jgi:hypothetical protein
MRRRYRPSLRKWNYRGSKVRVESFPLCAHEGSLRASVMNMPGNGAEPAAVPSGQVATQPDPGQIARRRAVSWLLVAEALLVVAPVFALSMFITGAQLVGKSITVTPQVDLFLQGCLLLVYVLVVLGLLAAARGVRRSSRGIAALLWQPVVVLFAAVPFLSYYPLTAKLPGGNWWLLILVVATTVMLVRVIPTPRQPRGYRRWPWWTAVAVVFLLLAGFGATNSALPWNPLSAVIDNGSGEAPNLANTTDMVKPEQNPGMAANPHNSIHNDSWQTDVYFRAAPDPVGSSVDTLFTGGDCATMTWDSQGRLVTLCISLLSVRAYVVDPATLDVLGTEKVGARSPSLTDFGGGGYFFLDNNDNIVFTTNDGKVRVMQLSEGAPVTITDTATFSVQELLQPSETVRSIMPDWNGRYWLAGNLGTVVTIDPDGSNPQAMNLSNEDIENSFAVAKDGAYLVTGRAMYHLQMTDDGAPAIVWRSEYDRGTRQKPGQTSQASGTTPSIFAGGDYVAIADNADPQMNVVVFETATGVQFCEVPVFAAGQSGTENALITAGDMIIVENNYGYAPAISTVANGHSISPGMAGVRVTESGCELAWENNEIYVPSVVSKATVKGNTIITYTKPPNRWSGDGWYFTGVDLQTGEVQWTRLSGVGLSYNSHYAATYLGPDGDIYTGTLHGISVMRQPGG